MMQHYLQRNLGEVDLRCFIVPSLLKRGWTRNLRRHLSENSLFCSDDSDDNGTFRSQVQMHGMGKPILVCEWPEKDAQLETYQVRLENSKGEKLGTIVAQHKPQLLKEPPLTFHENSRW
eukprot:symbB.v1.2.028461.t1/scaffold3015.1/size122727/1